MPLPISTAASRTPSKLSGLLCRPASGRLAAVRADGSEMTDEDFLAEAAAWREGFRQASRGLTELSRPRRVVLYAEDCAAFLPALFGAWAAGVETVLPGDALPGTLARMRQAGIIEPKKDFLALDAAALAAGPEGDGFAIASPADECLDGLSGEPFEALDDDAPLCSLFTSGTTGEAKRVPKRLGQLFLEAEGIAEAFADAGLSLDRTTLVMSTVTQQHIYGILFRALWPLLDEQAAVFGPRLHFPESLADALQTAALDGRGAVLISSPAHLRRYDDPELFAGSLGAVKAVASSAGALDLAGAIRSKEAFGCFPLEVLGSTETGGIARRQRRMKAGFETAPLSEVSVETPRWRPMPYVDVAVPGLTGGYAKSGTGILLVHARHLATRGWEGGADRIELAADGTFELLGRADRIVKIEGKRASLAEVETALLETGLFSEAKVFAESRRGREELAAVVVPGEAAKRDLLANGKAAFLMALRRRLAPRLPSVLIPRRWRFVDALPANAQGKVTQAALSALFDPRRPEWLAAGDALSPEGERTVTLQMRLMPSLAWFEGHFPEAPILPGVAQLLLVQRALGEFCAESRAEARRFSAPAAVKNLKFRQMTRPGAVMALTLSFASNAPSRVKFAWERLEKIEAPEGADEAEGTDAPDPLFPGFRRHLHATGTLEFSIPAGAAPQPAPAAEAPSTLRPLADDLPSERA